MNSWLIANEIGSIDGQREYMGEIEEIKKGEVLRGIEPRLKDLKSSVLTVTPQNLTCLSTFLSSLKGTIASWHTPLFISSFQCNYVFKYANYSQFRFTLI